jgi:hypothetical protein
MNKKQLIQRKPNRANTPERSFADKWRTKFRRRRRTHDPMLVLNMSLFNSEHGWNRVFSPVKVRENE